MPEISGMSIKGCQDTDKGEQPPVNHYSIYMQMTNQHTSKLNQAKKHSLIEVANKNRN